MTCNNDIWTKDFKMTWCNLQDLRNIRFYGKLRRYFREYLFIFLILLHKHSNIVTWGRYKNSKDSHSLSEQRTKRQSITKSDSLLTRCKSNSELMHSFILNCHKLQHSNIHHSGRKSPSEIIFGSFPDCAIENDREREWEQEVTECNTSHKQQHSSRERKKQLGNFANLPISSLCYLNAFAPSRVSRRALLLRQKR